MKLSIYNLDKPSDKRLKKIADYLVYVGLPAITVFFVTLQPVSTEFSLWGVAISTLLTTLLKGLTKFTSETEPLKESADEFEDQE